VKQYYKVSKPLTPSFIPHPLKIHHLNNGRVNVKIVYFKFTTVTSFGCGPGSSVDIATDYGLEGRGSNPGGDEIFRPSRPVLGPTQPPVKWVPVLSRVKCGRDVLLTIHPFLCRGHGRVELCLYPPSGPHRACNGITLLYFYLFL